MDRPVESAALRPLRLCLIGVAFAAALAGISLLSENSSASASESDAEGAGGLRAIVSPVAALVSPVTERIAAPVARDAVAVMDRVVESVVVETVTVESVAAPVAAVAVAAPLVADVAAVVAETTQAQVVGEVAQAVIAPVEPLVDPAHGSVGDGLSQVGPALPDRLPVSDGTAAEALVPMLSGGYPSGNSSPTPFVDRETGPAFPAAPRGQSGGGAAGGGDGGNTCPSDFPGASTPPLLPRGRHVTSGDDSAPAAPAFELCSSPG